MTKKRGGHKRDPNSHHRVNDNRNTELHVSQDAVDRLLRAFGCPTTAPRIPKPPPKNIK